MKRVTTVPISLSLISLETYLTSSNARPGLFPVHLPNELSNELIFIPQN